MFNAIHSNSGIKAFAFVELVELCERENQPDIVIERAKSIVKDSADWKLTVEEKRDLFCRIAKSLDRQGVSGGAFEVMHSYLKLFKAGDA